MTNADLSHYDTLQTRLAHERERLAAARTTNERELRAVWARQIEKEIAAELAFLGLDPAPASVDDISDADLAALLAE